MADAEADMKRLAEGEVRYSLAKDFHRLPVFSFFLFQDPDPQISPLVGSILQPFSEKLFRKGLEYAPDERAYLGIGILKQKKGEHGQAMEILSEGVAHFPLSEPLHVCLGISHMALGEYESAISCFSKFPESNQARSYMKACRRESGKIE